MAIDILKAFSTIPKKFDYVLPGLLPGTVGGLVSPGGSGKSMFALQMLCQIATGSPDFLNLGKLTTGKSVYLPAEDPKEVLLHRLFALSERYSKEQREIISQQLTIEPLLNHLPNLFEKKWCDSLQEIATDKRLMVIDTLRMFHSGDENDSGQMSTVIGKMKTIAANTGCCIIFLHHTSKASSLNGQSNEQQASRGSSVLIDNIRWQANMTPMTEEESKKYKVNRQFYVQLSIPKINYGTPFQPVWYKKVSCSNPEVQGGFTLHAVNLNKTNNITNGDQRDDEI